MIGEITKQSKEVLEQTVIKKPTAYYAMEGLGRGKQYASRMEGRRKRSAANHVQDSWDESLIMEFSDKLYNTSISRDTRTSFSVRHLINLEGIDLFFIFLESRFGGLSNIHFRGLLILDLTGVTDLF